ncbi:MAG: TadE/TadG family protein [Sphingomonadales bacterium]|nr:TadE/TadG family protein [Sphingomonadales bacterium]
MSHGQLIAGFRDALRRVAGDRVGSMLPLAAIGLMVILGLVGGAVDMSRLYKVQNRLQAACDSGVLAARKAVTTNGLDQAAQTQGKKFFDVNFDPAQQQVASVIFNTSSPNNGATVVGTATARVPMLIMGVFGVQQASITSTCMATLGINNVDVTFVLDITGSMAAKLGSTTRLQALKDAAKNFYGTLKTATTGTGARVRYAMVPFGSNVNIGHLIHGLNPAYLVDKWSYFSRLRFIRTETFGRVGSTSVSLELLDYAPYSLPTPVRVDNASYDSIPACLAKMPAWTGWVDVGAANSTQATVTIAGVNNVKRTTVIQNQAQTYTYCSRSGQVYNIWSVTVPRVRTTKTYVGVTAVPDPAATTYATRGSLYLPVAVDVSGFKQGNAITLETGLLGEAQSFTWDGCIEERYSRADASFTYDAASDRIQDARSLDLDIDTAPDPANDATKWAPAIDGGAIFGHMDPGFLYWIPDAVAGAGNVEVGACPSPSRALAEIGQSEFNGYIDSLTIAGATYHDFGMIWGARLSSPNGPWSALVNEAPSNNQTVSRHLILETDGDMNPDYRAYTMNGIEMIDRRTNDVAGKRLSSDNIPSAEDIGRHVSRFRAICDAVKARGIRIWVIATATNLNADLSYCASPNSAFTAASADGLNAAFQSIASQVTQLRVSG